MRKYLSCKFNILIWLGLAMTLNVNHVVLAETQSVSQLISGLQSGGYIIYMRHSKTSIDRKDQVLGELGDCSTQRNLSYEGKVLATRIAQKIKQLAIPIGQVYSSPYCRAKDTAQLTFNKVIVEPTLAFSITKSQLESKRLGEKLRLMMLETPVNSDNTVFVGHTSNLRGGLGIWPKPEGVWVIFKKTDSGIKYIGMISPIEWNDIPLT